MEDWVAILCIGTAIPAILVVIAVISRRARTHAPPSPPEGRSVQQQEALERRQALGYKQNLEGDH